MLDAERTTAIFNFFIRTKRSIFRTVVAIVIARWNQTCIPYVFLTNVAFRIVEQFSVQKFTPTTLFPVARKCAKFSCKQRIRDELDEPPIPLQKRMSTLHLEY